MKKLLALSLTVAVLGSGIVSTSAEARPGHRGHRVCRTHWVNHHKVRRCYWRR